MQIDCPSIQGGFLMRVIKDAAERQNQILDIAAKLFAQKGFDGTSTNDILEKAQIARGTLYYHFPSKESIMDALIQQQSMKLLRNAKEIADDKCISVTERIFNAVMALNASDKNSEELLRHMHKPQNALMHQKMQNTIINGLTPILTSIVNEGIEQGIFNSPFPSQSVEMMVVYAGTVFDDDFVPLSEEEQTMRIQAFLYNTERLLGAKPGSFIDVLRLFSGLEKEVSDVF